MGRSGPSWCGGGRSRIRTAEGLAIFTGHFHIASPHIASLLTCGFSVTDDVGPCWPISPPGDHAHGERRETHRACAGGHAPQRSWRGSLVMAGTAELTPTRRDVGGG